MTVLCKNDETDKRVGVRENRSRRSSKSKWVAKFDEESGEGHIFMCMFGVDYFLGKQIAFFFFYQKLSQ